MNKLENKIQNKLNEINQLESQLINFEIDENYSVEPTVNYDRVVFTIAHKQFNWTDFLQVTISPKRSEPFDFSHGTGGFHNCTVTERLTATSQMFKIVESIQSNTDTIIDIFNQIKIKDNELKSLQYELSNIIKLEQKDNFIQDLRKTHRPIVIIDDFINSLKDEISVELIAPKFDSYKSIYVPDKIIVENISNNRTKLRLNHKPVSKKVLKDFLSRVDCFIEF